MAPLFLTLLATSLALAVANPELEQLVKSIAKSFEVNHANGNNGESSPLLSLANGQFVDLTMLSATKNETIKVKVVFSGTVLVTAEANGKGANVTTDYAGGAAVVVNAEEGVTVQLNDDVMAQQEAEVNQVLEPLYEEFSNTHIGDNDVGILIAHGAKKAVKVKDGKKTAEAKVCGGFVVGLKTTVKS